MFVIQKLISMYHGCVYFRFTLC